jgi:hypothetical protein
MFTWYVMQVSNDCSTLPPDVYKPYLCCQQWSPGTPSLSTSVEDPSKRGVAYGGAAAFCSSQISAVPYHYLYEIGKLR